MEHYYANPLGDASTTRSPGIGWPARRAAAGAVAWLLGRRTSVSASCGVQLRLPGVYGMPEWSLHRQISGSPYRGYEMVHVGDCRPKLLVDSNGGY